MYAVSYMWYAVIGTVTCITVGFIVGALTGKETDKFDERLLHPVVAKLYRKMPGAKRTYSVEKSEEKESSVKTEVTVDDNKCEASHITEIKHRIPNSKSEGQNGACIKNGTIEIKNGLNNNGEGLDGKSKKFAVNKEVPLDVTMLSSSSSRLFDAYDSSRGSPTLRTRM